MADVSDGYGNARVAVYSYEGIYLREWGAAGGGDGLFRIPHSITLDLAGRAYVADRENSRVQEVNLSALHDRWDGVTLATRCALLAICSNLGTACRRVLPHNPVALTAATPLLLPSASTHCCYALPTPPLSGLQRKQRRLPHPVGIQGDWRAWWRLRTPRLIVC